MHVYIQREDLLKFIPKIVFQNAIGFMKFDEIPIEKINEIRTQKIKWNEDKILYIQKLREDKAE